MEWTREQKLAALMRLPWTVRAERNTEDGYLVARVAELPSVLATGENDRELGRDLWESLEASLSCYLEFDDPIPLPKGVRLPWEGKVQRPQRSLVHINVGGAAWDALATSDGATGRLIEV